MSAPYPEKTDYPAEAPPPEYHAAAGYPSQEGQPYPPQGGQPYPPQGGQPQTPQGGQPYPPQGGQPYPPQGGQPYPPQGGQPYPPQGGQPYPPQGGQPYTPQGGQPYPPQGYPPQGQGAPPLPNYNAQYAAPQPGVTQSGIKYTAVPQTTMIVRESQVQPKDYLKLAIFVAVCCCLPVGIIAILKAIAVRSLHQSGDFAGAEAASLSARNFSIVGVVMGIVMEIIIIISMTTRLINASSYVPSY